jgi:hypothetical protein
MLIASLFVYFSCFRANDKVASKGRSSTMTSYKDRTLSTGVFFMDLLFSIEPRIIDWDFVKAGDNDEEKLLNAKYAISVARKLGAVIFLLPEDIVEVRIRHAHEASECRWRFVADASLVLSNVPLIRCSGEAEDDSHLHRVDHGTGEVNRPTAS